MASTRIYRKLKIARRVFNPESFASPFASPLFREGERMKVRGFSDGDVTTGRNPHPALSLAKGEASNAQNRYVSRARESTNSKATVLIEGVSDGHKDVRIMTSWAT